MNEPDLCSIRSQCWGGSHVVTAKHAGKVIVRIGEATGVKVNVHPNTGKVKYASAHDLRRAFGERWATRVMPPVLQQLMRHESIDTTLRYYVGRNAEATAEAVWDAFQVVQGNTSGNTPPTEPSVEPSNTDASSCKD